MSTLRVFVAGGSGTIGIPLVRALVEAGHHVTALTRSADKQQSLLGLGATPAVADALDAARLTEVVLGARPTHVIHQLTALPKEGARRASDLAPTNRLRIEGTRNLLAAAIAAGATRLIGGSFAPILGVGPNDEGGSLVVCLPQLCVVELVEDERLGREFDLSLECELRHLLSSRAEPALP